MKPKAVFKRHPLTGPLWMLLNWQTKDGAMILAPTLGSLLDYFTKISAGPTGNSGTNPLRSN